MKTIWRFIARLPMKRTLFYLLTLYYPLSGMAVESYIAANKNAQIIRVDRIPLDAPTIGMLSQALSALAQREQAATPGDLRCSAQLIGLSLRLDGRNEHAQRLNNMLERGKIRQFTEPKDLNLAIKRVEEIVRYLERDGVGEEANLLADMIKDTLVFMDRSNPLLEGHQVNSRRWANIVPNTSHYVSPAEVLVENEPKKLGDENLVQPEQITPAPVNEEEVAVVTDPVQEEPSNRQVYPTEYSVTKSKLLFPSLFKELKEEFHSAHDQYRYYEVSGRLAELSITVRQSEEVEVNFLQAVDSEDYLNEGEINTCCLAALETRWRGEFPKGKVEVGLPYGYSRLGRSTMAAPIAMMTDSLLSGKPLREKLIIGFALAKGGAVIRPNTMWVNLKTLRNVEDSHRIIVSPSSEADFLQLLALEEWEFLLKNEVIGAADFSEAVAWGQEEIETDFYALASALFEEVQQAAPSSSSLKAFIENPFVREKLEKIMELCPTHISAKLLLAVGAGKGKKTLDDRFYALDMQDVLRSFSRLIRSDNHLTISSSLAYEVHEELEESLENMVPFLSSDQEEAFEDVETMNAELRSLARSLKEKGDSFHDRQAMSSLESLKTLYLLIESKLKDLAG